MSDPSANTAGELLKGQTSDAEGLASLLNEYADVIADCQAYALAAKRFASLPAVIDVLNSQLDKSKYALYAELPMHSNTYTLNEAEGTWTPSHHYLVQGKVRPFIGDELVLAGDVLLLVDSARQVGVGHFTNLQIRPKEDAVVEHFSDDEAVGTIRKLGEVASQNDRTVSLITDRWDQVRIDPPLA